MTDSPADYPDDCEEEGVPEPITCGECEGALFYLASIIIGGEYALRMTCARCGTYDDD